MNNGLDNIIVLYDIKSENGDWFRLIAYVDSHSLGLVLSGHDYLEAAEEMFGDEEYEYYYTFSKEDTEKKQKYVNIF